MINIIGTDEICSRLEHSKRFKNGVECHALPMGEASPQTCSTVDVFNGNVARTRTPHGWEQRDATRKIVRALAYMLQNLDKPIQMPALGALAGVSMSHFYHLFKLATGCTPNDFFIRARLRRASELLQETDLSVKEVAAALGYDDPFYFSRMFKSVHGVSPKEYRVIVAKSECSPPKKALEVYERKTSESFLPFAFEPQPKQQNHALTKC